VEFCYKKSGTGVASSGMISIPKLCKPIQWCRCWSTDTDNVVVSQTCSFFLTTWSTLKMWYETVIFIGDVLLCVSEMISARIEMDYVYQVTGCHG